MKSLTLCLALLAVTLLASMNAPAQGTIALGAGVDLMLPVGSFGDAWKTGFGATGELDYAVKPDLSVTGKIGYLTWSGKNLPSNVTATYSGVPLLVGGKYYFHFMSGAPVRGYGHLEMGLMIGSLSTSGTRLFPSASKTDFAIVPSVGVEIPAGLPKGNIDISVRYFDVSTKSSIGFKVGYLLVM